MTTTPATDLDLEPYGLSLHPNPVSGHFTISGTTGDYTIQILNTLGQVYQNIQSTGQITIDTSNLPAGLFFVSVRNDSNNQVCLQKIIKE